MQGQNHSGVAQHTTTGTHWQQFISPAIFNRPGAFPRSAWTEHIPFAFWLVEILQPEIIVELGTHYGASYFAFCQAVEKSGIVASCYAVDNWTGDVHAGFYDNTVFEQVQDINQQYQSFSTLYRNNFDEALPFFDDASIDLLHIDGLHTYEAVKHDFVQWLPKVSEKGIVLFHDTAVTDRSFGVQQLWKELSLDYPSFEFDHGFGLGILGIGQNLPIGIKQLFNLKDDAATQAIIQHTYQRLGFLFTLEQEQGFQPAALDNNEDKAAVPQEVEDHTAITTASAEAIASTQPQACLPLLENLSVQVFWKIRDEAFTEAASVHKTLELQENNADCVLKTPEHITKLYALRIDPATQSGIFYLHSINFTSGNGQSLMGWAAIQPLCCFKNMLVLKSSFQQGGWLVMCITPDPMIEILLPSFEPTLITAGISISLTCSKLNNEMLQQELSGISIAQLSTHDAVGE